MIAPPLLDRRTAEEIAGRLVTLLEEYTTPPDATVEYPFPPWKEYDPATRAPLGLSAALIGIFARYAELVIQRLNRVPEKSFLAFLDLLGAARLPPEPAHVPLTFSLVAGRTEDAVVPAGTRVAAQPAVGDTGPVVFEVERPLVVTAVQLASLVTLDPEQDAYADLGGRDPATAAPFLAFQGNRPVERALYLGDDRLLGYANIKALRLVVARDSASPLGDPRLVRWERWDGAAWAGFVPVSDGTAELTTSGTINFGPFAPLPSGQVGSRQSRWIRARLLTPVTGASGPAIGMVRSSQLPRLASVQVEVEVEKGTVSQAPPRLTGGIRPEAGFANGTALDLTQEVYPFGERPKLLDTFYLASLEGFSRDPAAVGPVEISLDMDVALAGVPRDLALTWECSSTEGWTSLAGTGFQDGTSNFTQSGLVQFRLPATAAKATVNGRESHWIRVRITAGNYGEEAHYAPDGNGGYTFVPATFKPPLLKNLRVGYKLTARRTPEAALASSYLELQDVTALAAGAGFSPFVHWSDLERPSLFMGFTVPAPRTSFPNATLGLYASVAAVKYGERAAPLAPDMAVAGAAAGTSALHAFTVTNTSTQARQFLISTLGHAWATIAPTSLIVPAGESFDFSVQVSIPPTAQPGDSDRGFLQVRAASDPSTVYGASFETTAGVLPTTAPPRLRWEYWNGTGWAELAVRDGSQAFTLPGLVELLAPKDFTRRSLFGSDRYWLRASWDEGDYSAWPRLKQVLLNTTPAVQSVTVLNEILGSSTGTKGQTFRSTRAPVLEGAQLEVREPELPGAGELEALYAEEGEDAVPSTSGGATARLKDIWVRWHEVPDFYASGPRDRHYVMDHLTGVISFGDGITGMIPPIGSSNVRLAKYRTGGGATTNRAAGTVTQLKTTVPYIDKVTNPEPATGGAEAEPVEALYERMPRTLRHRDRAVTVEDYEDLAALASSEVARSRCVPLRDLIADPLGSSPRPGMVSVIVVPRTSDAKPQPTMELLGRVHSYLEERAPAGAGLSVVGPLYIRVDVRAEIGVASLDDAGAISSAVQARLAAFLHPLTGGMDQKGWGFGRAPHRSDFMALIEGVEGVDHVRFLSIEQTEELEGVRQTGRFLVYSGAHQIDLVFEEP